MDSQATLVNPTELPERYAHTELVFDRDSLTNADIRVRGGRAVVYTIRTTGRSLSHTEVTKVASGEVVVCIERKDILPDTIRFRDGPTVKMKKWIKHKTFAVSLPGCAERQYTWKPMSLREIALYDALNPYAPVAWFRTTHRREVDGLEVVEPPTSAKGPVLARPGNY